MSTSDEADQYEKILNYYRNGLDHDNKNKLAEYNHAFFYYDPETTSCPYDVNDIDIHSQKSSTISPISSKRELFKALVISGRIIDNDDDDGDIMNAGDSSDSDTSTFGNDKKRSRFILLDIITRVEKKTKTINNKPAARSNKKKVAFIEFKIHPFVNYDTNLKKYWVDKKVIKTFLRPFTDVENSIIRAGELFTTIKKQMIENDESNELKVGKKSALFITLDRRERNELYMRKITKSSELIRVLKLLAGKESDDTMMIDVAIGEKADGDGLMADLPDTDAHLYSQQEVDDPKAKNIKKSSRDQRSASFSMESSNRHTFRKICFDQDSPYQYRFSREMEGIVLKRMEVNETYAKEVKMAVLHEEIDQLSFSFIDDDVRMKEHGITFNMESKYMPTFNQGKPHLPKAISTNGNANNTCSGRSNNISEALDSTVQKFTDVASSVTRKATSIKFIRDKDEEPISCSLKASDVTNCKNGEEILSVANQDHIDINELFCFEAEYDSIFTDKTHTLLFDFVDFNLEFYLEYFKTAVLQDILIGDKPTVEIKVSVVPIPVVESNRPRHQF